METLHLPRIMLAAPSSGSGKTLVTCGLLQALVNRNIRAASFKCGPDYIDPMFHARVIGTPSRNLDTFFTDAQTTRRLFGRQAKKAEVSVLEGVMGFYDGVAGITTEASSWELARVTETPVILVVNARGMSGLSAAALIRGFLDFPCELKEDDVSFREKVNLCDARGNHEKNAPCQKEVPEKSSHADENVLPPSCICGVILNQTSAAVYPEMKREIEKRLPVRVLGYVPRVEDCVIESRHLGLVTPAEIADLKEKLQKLADILEETLDVDGILKLAQSALPLDISMSEMLKSALNDFMPEVWKSLREDSVPDLLESSVGRISNEECSEREKTVAGQLRKLGADKNPKNGKRANPVRIAVARDEAFCFYYEDNLELLQMLGAELIYFSPLHDAALPADIGGLILGGGYPELYAERLSGNLTMLDSVKSRISAGLPYLAECGGFMYLHETMEDMGGQSWPMAGVLPGHVKKTEHLTRFGYVTLTANEPQIFGEAGAQIRAHEFHYFDSTENGAAFHAQKPHRKRSWDCMVAGESYAAGFPHLYYYSNPEFAARFVEKCRDYGLERCEQ